MIKLLSAISLFGTLANIAHAQTTITTTLNGQPTTLELGYFIQPSGVQKVRGSFSDSTPLVCTSVCYAIETVYGGCFLDYKVPFQNGTEEFSTFDYSLEVCTDFFCSGSQYQVFAACMNCIVANGGGTTPDANALPSEWAINRGAAATQVIDQSRAQGWLRNVTDYCAANGVGVGDGEEVTATPTTTGPYSTTWRVRDTVVIPQWTQYTGLTAHVSTIEAQILSGYLYAATATYTDDLPTRTTSPTGTDQTTRTSQTQGGSATSSAPASASTSSYAHRSCGSEWAGALAGGWLMVAWFYAL